MKRLAALALVSGFVATIGVPTIGLAEIPLTLEPFGQAGPKPDRLKLELSPAYSVVTPGQEFWVAVTANVASDAWLYGPSPRGRMVEPVPLRIALSGEGLAQMDVWYPTPHWHVTPGEFGDEHIVYTGRPQFYVRLKVAADAEPGPRTIQIDIDGQVCDDSLCYNIFSLRTPLPTASIEIGQSALPATGEAFAPPPAEMEGYHTAEQWDAILPDKYDDADPEIRYVKAPAGVVEPATQAAAQAEPTSEAGAPLPKPSSRDLADANPYGDLSIAAALGLAVLAGLIINVMPCVLPVIPLKILSIVEQSRGSRRRGVTLGLAFAGGIFLFFAGMAVIAVVVRLAFGSVFSWNELLQTPWAIIALAMVMWVLALNLFNVFTVSVGGSLAGRGPAQGHAGSAFTGFLAAVLSTPCSFAVLAAVLAWAVFQPAWLGAVTFLLVGVGMAGPHVLLTSFPSLLSKMPKPGPWMEHFKKAMGLILLLVAAWLVSILGNSAWIGWVVAYAVVLGVAVWMSGSWVNFNTPTARKWTVRIAALVLVAAAAVWMLPAPSGAMESRHSVDIGQVGKARQENRIVLVKFTASWCLSCKVVDLSVYQNEEVKKELADRNIDLQVADMTWRESQAAEMMREHFPGYGPPLSVVYPPGNAKPILLPGKITREELFAALDQAEQIRAELLKAEAAPAQTQPDDDDGAEAATTQPNEPTATTTPVQP